MIALSCHCFSMNAIKTDEDVANFKLAAVTKLVYFYDVNIRLLGKEKEPTLGHFPLDRT